MENNIPNIKKDKYKLLTPELFPALKKKTNRFEMDEEKMKEIGEISHNLLKLNEISIYRMLSNKENDYFINFVNTEKSLQNKYLKKIVEANNDYFPLELSQDKLQKKTISIEEQMKIKMQTMKDKPTKGKKNKKNDGQNVSRKESYIDALAANDLAELPKRKVFEEKEKNNNMNDVNVVDDDEDMEEEKDEENDEEPSYEDDYRIDSDGDNGGSDGDNYSDGGVF
jgi:hypothetical protein